MCVCVYTYIHNSRGVLNMVYVERQGYVFAGVYECVYMYVAV
jgi:hypothetical protein